MPEKQRSAFRLDVDSPIALRLDEFSRTMNVTLVDLSEGGCRIRSKLCLPRSSVSFTWTGPSQEPMKVWGSMAGARITKRKQAEFGIRFEMPQNEKDRLVAELHEIQRRSAFKSGDLEGGAEAVGRAQRNAYRAPVRFNLTLKTPAKTSEISGMAYDLSIGGILLVTREKLTQNTEIELNFTMPVEAVDLGGEQREVSERTPFGERKVKKLVPVRPFDPVRAKAKVIKRVGSTLDGTSYGMCFLDLSAFMREEIARFVHAHQLTQLRRVAASDA